MNREPAGLVIFLTPPQTCFNHAKYFALETNDNDSSEIQHLARLSYILSNSAVVQEIKWPDADERAHYGSFLEKWGHPDFRKIVYIADGMKVTMRNPSKVCSTYLLKSQKPIGT